MGIIRRADAQDIARDALVLDLGRLEAQGDALVEHARQRAEQIIAEARAERERLLADARAVGHREGLEAGHAEGLERGRDEGRQQALADASEHLRQLEAGWSSALDLFTSARVDMLADARDDLIGLACEIARRATGRIVAHDPSVAVDSLAEVLGIVTQSTTLRVRIHPEDEAIIAAALPELRARFSAVADLELIPDPDLSRGACVADTDRRGTIDSSVGTRLDRLIEAIMPGAAP